MTYAAYPDSLTAPHAELQAQTTMAGAAVGRPVSITDAEAMKIVGGHGKLSDPRFPPLCESCERQGRGLNLGGGFDPEPEPIRCTCPPGQRPR